MVPCATKSIYLFRSRDISKTTEKWIRANPVVAVVVVVVGAGRAVHGVIGIDFVVVPVLDTGCIAKNAPSASTTGSNDAYAFYPDTRDPDTRGWKESSSLQLQLQLQLQLHIIVGMKPVSSKKNW